MSRHRNYVFTINDPVDWDPEATFQASERIIFLAGQLEVGAVGKRIHFQGYCQLRNPVGLSGIKELLGRNDAHVEPRRGTHEEAIKYVHKEATRMEGSVCLQFGEPRADQGNRSDLDTARQTLLERGLLGVADESFGTFLRYYKGLALYQSMVGAARDPVEEPQCRYYWGPAGSGKTRAVWDSVPSHESVYPVPVHTSPWFDGYVPGQHTVMLLDDYYHNWPVTFLLRLLDRYPMQLPVKGSHVNMGKVAIYITSNIPLEQQYPNYPDQGALRRRFTEIKHFQNL